MDARVEIEDRIDLSNIFNELPPREQLILALWVYGYNQTEIGQIIGVQQPRIAKILSEIGIKFGTKWVL